MAEREFSSEIDQLSATLSGIEQVLDVDALRAQAADLEKQASDPDLWNDPANAQKVTSRLSSAQSDIRRLGEMRAGLDDLPVLLEMAQEADGDDAVAAFAELETELDAMTRSIADLEVRTLLSGEYDSRDALVNLRAGAGGVDAADFTDMLLRMYLRWAERHGYAVDVYDTSYAEEAGIKSATFVVHAPFAYGTLSVEQGTHRLVRISPFDNQNRRQTSFAEVEVLPVVEQTDHITIPDDEIRVDVYRSSGPGGQGVNTTDSAVRLTHVPTGIVVTCQNERSQLQNRARAMEVLQAKLLERQRADEQAKMDALKGDTRRLVGQPDAFLRASPLPDGQRPAHRVRGGQHQRGVRRRHRRLSGGRHPLAALVAPYSCVVIRFDDVSKVYPKTSRAALSDVSVELAKGEFVFLVGESGSGKSTFLRLVLREERPSSGHIQVAGKDLARLSQWKVPALRRQIGTVFQDFRLLPNKTVAQNVAFALQVIGKSRKEIAEDVPEVLDLVGLDGKENRLPAPAVRRRAAARRDRARLRQPAADPAGRRADRQPRPGHQRGHHAAARPHQPHRHDGRHGHARRRVHRRPDAQAGGGARPAVSWCATSRAASTATRGSACTCSTWPARSAPAFVATSP